MYLLSFLCLFILREREGERMNRGWGANREEKRIPSRLLAVSMETITRLSLINCEVMTWAEIKSWMLNQLSNLGAAPPPPRVFCVEGNEKDTARGPGGDREGPHPHPPFFFERENMQEPERGAEGAKERISSRLHVEPDMGLDLMTTRTWPEPKSRVGLELNWLSHPGTFMVYFHSCFYLFIF